MITRVPGFRVGHWTRSRGLTGCTVVLCPPGTVGSVDVKGGAPGTRETDAIRPGTLDARGPRRPAHGRERVRARGGRRRRALARGTRDRLRHRRGTRADRAGGRAVRPRRSATASARPDAAAGAAACDAATDGAVAEGSVGAGTGATVAKSSATPAAGWKGGVGTAAVEEDGLVVAALAAVNALGAVTEDDGTPIAANREPGGASRGTWPGGNTTLVVVATNAVLSKERAQLLAQAGSEGLSLAVRPSHTMWDGDMVFALGSGVVDGGAAGARGDGDPGGRRGDPPRRSDSPSRSAACRRWGRPAERAEGAAARGGGMRTLEEAAREAATCTRCRLSQGRTQVVYGVGEPERRPDVHRRGPRLSRGQAGRAVRRRRRASC